VRQQAAHAPPQVAVGALRALGLYLSPSPAAGATSIFGARVRIAAAKIGRGGVISSRPLTIGCSVHVRCGGGGGYAAGLVFGDAAFILGEASGFFVFPGFVTPFALGRVRGGTAVEDCG